MVCLRRVNDEIKHRMNIWSVFLYFGIFDIVAKPFGKQITTTTVKVALQQLINPQACRKWSNSALLFIKLISDNGAFCSRKIIEFSIPKIYHSYMPTPFLALRQIGILKSKRCIIISQNKHGILVIVMYDARDVHINMYEWRRLKPFLIAARIIYNILWV